MASLEFLIILTHLLVEWRKNHVTAGGDIDELIMPAVQRSCGILTYVDKPT